jgi:hypothetical protein
VPTKVCTLQTQVVCVKVPYTVCKTVPYTVCVKVPYTVTEMVPTTVRKTVKVCVPYDVCVRKARYVPYTVCDAAPCPACPEPGARRGLLERLCQAKKGLAGSECTPVGETAKPCQAPACPTVGDKPCNDRGCDDGCASDGCRIRKRPGLLARFFHRRLACEPTCCGCTCNPSCN